MPRSGGRAFGDDDAGAGQASEMPTPPAGLPLDARAGAGPDPDGADATPPIGIEGLSAVVSAEDFGQAGPAVLGADDQPEAGSHNDAGDWPTLEYRSRNKPTRRAGALNWLRRRGGSSE